MSDPQVTNNAGRSRFEIRAEDGRLAGFAEYVAADGVREFTHAVVRDAFEGQGIGGRARPRRSSDQTPRRRPAEWSRPARSSSGWIGKHPDYQDLLA